MKKKTTKEIEQFLNDYHISYFNHRDFKKTLLFYKDTGSVIGTGLDEIGYEKQLEELY